MLPSRASRSSLILAGAVAAAGCFQRKPERGAAPGPSPAAAAGDKWVAAAAQDPPLTAPFTDDFDRAAIGPDYRSTTADGVYRLSGGALEVQNAFNHGLWLARKLPRDFVVELDVWSMSPDGDIKLELCGDGHTFATEDEYTASGYVLIFGGWHDTISVIARMAEHGTDRQERTDVRVEPGRHYHYRIERVGNKLTWYIDGSTFMTYDDPQPLAGPGHDHLAFNTWQANVFYDNLKISPYVPDNSPRP